MNRRNRARLAITLWLAGLVGVSIVLWKLSPMALLTALALFAIIIGTALWAELV